MTLDDEPVITRLLRVNGVFGPDGGASPVPAQVRNFLATLAIHRELPFGIADEALSLLRRCGDEGAKQWREHVARGIWRASYAQQERLKGYGYHVSELSFAEAPTAYVPEFDPWDTVSFDGQVVPGPCRVRVDPSIPAPGTSYAFQVEITFGEKNFGVMQAFVAKIWGAPIPGEKPKVWRVEHPELELRSIREAMVIGISASRDSKEIPGAKVIALKCVEYLRRRA